MGSAGRGEHQPGSDQDHGLVYDQGGEEVQQYFLALGREISRRLADRGYPLCMGHVMSSIPRWCRSRSGWQSQLEQWLREKRWETLRYVLIFMDARPLVGDSQLVIDLRERVYGYCAKDPAILLRLWENTAWLKKGMGLFGQFLTEEKGPHAGAINLKETGLFPYINAIRLLAIRESVHETSTALRLERLCALASYGWLETYQAYFKRLMAYRKRAGVTNHPDYIRVADLSREEKKELKHLIRKGAELYRRTGQWLKRGTVW
ncbi:CBS domain-containing protein [Caldalkalibacillus uzonensis]|uniref:CBS domain-containing protein n=2 Tax=Caldalkalibacillus uzonensis TaxID=353224 RepID=A0ABU0CT23_9BACI|nr:CBS domain-containing protein [Caldalkalibacillus uzonensis]